MIEIIFGLIFGVLGGIGLGGGSVLIPLLVLILGVPIQNAQGASIVAFLPAPIVALIVHFINKKVEIKVAIEFILIGSVFAFLGAYLMQFLPKEILTKAFGVFLIGFSIFQALSISKTLK